MPFVTLPTDREMYYEVEGSGPPLLLTMGTASSHDTWDGQVAAYRHRSIGISSHFTIFERFLYSARNAWDS